MEEPWDNEEDEEKEEEEEERVYAGYLHPEERNAGQQIHGGFEVHQFLLAGRREVIPVHGQVYAQRVVQLVEQLDEFLLLQNVRAIKRRSASGQLAGRPGNYPEIGRRETVAGAHRRTGGRVRVVRVDVGQQGAHRGRHAGTQVFGGETMEVAVSDNNGAQVRKVRTVKGGGEGVFSTGGSVACRRTRTAAHELRPGHTHVIAW